MKTSKFILYTLFLMLFAISTAQETKAVIGTPKKAIKKEVKQAKSLQVYSTAEVQSPVKKQKFFVTGTVLDKNSLETIPGAKVYIKEFNLVGRTDFDGTFKIETPMNSQKITLSIQSIDMKNFEIFTDNNEKDAVEFGKLFMQPLK